VPVKIAAVGEAILQKPNPILKGRAQMDRVKRSFSDRRSGKDRRKILSLRHLGYKGSDRRTLMDRRSKIERRDGWVKIGKWSSVKMQDLKIAKYLR